MLRHNRSDRCAQAPTCPITLDSAADPPARGIPDAKGIGIPILPACLKNKSGSHVFPTFGSNSQKFGTPGQSADSGAHRIKLRGASGPFCAAGQGPDGRPWWPCANESHGAERGQAFPVDRYVSRLTLRSPRNSRDGV
jgi:hypothetical protein